MMSVILFSYPLFLAVAIIFTARKYSATTPLYGIARWLLAIALAYGVTFGLMFVFFLLGGGYYDSDYMISLYFVRLVKEASGLASLLLVVGLVLLGIDRLRNPKRGKTHSEADIYATLTRTSWTFTFLFAIALLLAVIFLIEPYFDAQANADRVYAATHNYGLDPRDWFPFSWEWPGILLYQIAFWVWSFIAFFLLPLVAAQAFTLKRIWRKLQRSERILHAGSAATAGLLSVFMLTFGGFILYWLAD